MSLNLRYPNITGFTEKEQLAQIKSFLHQLVNELNFAPIGDSSGQSASYEVQGGTVSYYELQSLIVQQIQKMDSNFAQLSTKLENDVDGYVDTAVGEALQEAKESGEFDGPKGDDGKDGEPGVTRTLLWENASPDSAFAAQSIAVATGDYDSFEFVCYIDSYNFGNVHSQIVTPYRGDDGLIVPYSGTHVLESMNYARRLVTISEDAITFADGQGNNNGTWGVGNRRIVPVQIYGIKATPNTILYGGSDTTTGGT